MCWSVSESMFECTGTHMYQNKFQVRLELGGGNDHMCWSVSESMFTYEDRTHVCTY
jgi:hypothetical protein